MMDYMVAHQLNIMQALSGVCGVVACLLLVTKVLSRRRKNILMLLELTSMFLLIFDRMAYIYAGDPGRMAYIMVRVSNFMVFFLTAEVVFAFNLYLIDLLSDEGGMTEIPKRLELVNILSMIAMILVVVSQFTNIIYYIDENNRYQRAPLFAVCYVIPIVGPIIQFSVIMNHKKRINRNIYISLLLFLVAPVLASIIQLFSYGISLTNMVIVIVSVSLYIFAYFDINEKVELAHKKETEHLEEDRRSIKRLFDQMATAFVDALDERETYTKGHSKRVAKYAREIARNSGMDERECEDVYYAALLHEVGKIGIPESIITKDGELTEEEKNVIKSKPEIGNKILSSVTEYPNISIGAHYGKERYDGTGYPEGLKGDRIPKIARIVSVANAYDVMTSRNANRAPLPQPLVREEFIKESGGRFDPEYVKGMLKMMDEDSEYKMRVQDADIDADPVNELFCKEYRDSIKERIIVDTNTVTIHFRCDPDKDANFSMPSLILYDSFDSRVHNNERTIKAFNYREYGELWFDGHNIATEVRNLSVTMSEADEIFDDNEYEIEAVRYEDHFRVRLKSSIRVVEATAAMYNGSTWIYIGLTGEHCHIYDIDIRRSDEPITEGEIERIADEISYIDRLESDIPNIQINATRSATTKGVLIEDGMRVDFHAMALPVAQLVWHCPYIVIFYSENGMVGGPDYREYAFIKINGEDDGTNDYATNKFVMKRTEDFRDWETFEEKMKIGIECDIRFSKRGKRVGMKTSNLGIEIENTTTLKYGPSEIYFALTGDEVALTDIRIS